MSHRKPARAVENYTMPFWVTMGTIFFMGSWLIASLYGFATVLMTAAILDVFAKLLARRVHDD